MIDMANEKVTDSPAQMSKTSSDYDTTQPSYNTETGNEPLQLKKANSFTIPVHTTSSNGQNPLTLQFQKSKDLKFYDMNTGNNNENQVVNKAELQMLEDENLNLKSEMEKYKSLYIQEKSYREHQERQAEEHKRNSQRLEEELARIRENGEMVRELGRDLEKENLLLKNQLGQMNNQMDQLLIQLSESKQREETAKISLSQISLEHSGQNGIMDKDKEQMYQKAVGTLKYIRKESYEMAKKLKQLKPEWRPNTQNDKIFIKEVFSELWGRLEQLNSEKQRRDNESLMFLSNKNFIDEQVNLSGNQSGSKQIIKQSLENKKNFENAMHILDDIVTNIEEANTNFDDSVIDEQDKKLDSERVFDGFITFFDRVEKIKEGVQYKQLMDLYYS